VARVVELNYFPVKGCAGTSVTEAVVAPAGLAHDRTFLVTDQDGVFRSQRGTPRMAVLRPEVDTAGTRLTLRVPDTDPVHLAVDVTAPRRDVTMFGRPYRGIDQGDAVAGWLSDVLGAPSRLVRVPPEHDRVTDGETPGTSGYADSSAVLVTTLLSLSALNERIVARGGQPVPMDRFRANIVLDGWDEPHAEDFARRIAVGNCELGFTKIAVRCAVTTVDQRTGEKSGPEPLRTLAGYRRADTGGVAFGVKFAVLRPGKVSVGDQVSVASWAHR